VRGALGHCAAIQFHGEALPFVLRLPGGGTAGMGEGADGAPLD
jgi:hypothetical protein